MLISYAQNFEDVILWRALRHVERGFYVDIGAQDPVMDSVSLAFYKLGWRGVHVEPTPAYAQALRLARPDESVLQAAVSDRGGLISLHEIPHTGLSTGEAQIAESHARAGFAPQETDVPAITLEALLERYGDQEIHWLKIDVEGMEGSVLRSWGAASARPWIIVIEATVPLGQQTTHEAWESLLVERGYVFVYWDGLNRFYVSKQRPELVSAFSAPPNVFDNFALSGTGSHAFSAKLNEVIDGLKRDASRLESQSIEFVANADKRCRELEGELTAERTAIGVERESHRLEVDGLRDGMAQLDVALQTSLRAQSQWDTRLGEIERNHSVHRSDVQRHFDERLNERENTIALLRQTLVELKEEFVNREQLLDEQLKAAQMDFRLREKAFETSRDRDIAIQRQTTAEWHERLDRAHAERNQALELVRGIETHRDATQERLRIIERARDTLLERLREVEADARAANERAASAASSFESTLATARLELVTQRAAATADLTRYEATLVALRQELDEVRRRPFWHLGRFTRIREHTPRRTKSEHSFEGRQTDPRPIVAFGSIAPKPSTPMHTTMSPGLTTMQNHVRSQSTPPAEPDLSSLLRLEGIKFVQQAYLAILKRPADPGGLSFWQERLNTGVSKQAVLRQLLDSAEALQLGVELPHLRKSLNNAKPAKGASGATNASTEPRDDSSSLNELLALNGVEFVDAAYRALLKREADADGRRFYLSSLCDGTAKIDILGQLYQSNERAELGLVSHELERAMRSFRLSKMPLIGAFLRGRNAEGGSLADARMRRIEQTVIASAKEMSAHVARWHREVARNGPQMDEIQHFIRRGASRVDQVTSESDSFTSSDLAPRRIAALPTRMRAHSPVSRNLLPVIYFFVDHTVKCPVNTGMQRVVRRLSRALLERGEQVVLVKWNAARQQIVRASRQDLDHLSKWNGPQLAPAQLEAYPDATGESGDTTSIDTTSAGAWLVVPEVTHITYHNAPVTLDIQLAARRVGLRTAFIYYDAVPLRLHSYRDTAEQHETYMQQLLFADLILAISHRSADELRQFLRVHQSNRSATPAVHALPLPAESQLSARLKHLPDQGDGTTTILCVGSIEPRKNQLALLQAFQDYCDRHPESSWRLVLAGHLRGDVALHVMTYIERNPRISHVQSISDPDLDLLYRSSAFTVFPSVEEGFGLPILESLWYAKPCLCADFGAMREVADGGGCYVVDTRSVAAIGTGLERLTMDSALRNRLAAEASRRRLTTWSDYAGHFTQQMSAQAEVACKLGTIYYWVDDTCVNANNSGIQRVTRQLAKALLGLGADVVPVRWVGEVGFVQPTSTQIAHLERWDGPVAATWSPWRQPSSSNGDEVGWLLIPELTHGELPAIRKYAAAHGLRSAAVFYDAIPHKLRDDYGQVFGDNHRRYMQDVLAFDRVFPISNFSRTDLLSFYLHSDFRSVGLDMRVTAIALPDQFVASRQAEPLPIESGRVRILSVISIEPRKNPLTLLAAFEAATGRIAIPLELTIVGRRIPAFENLAKQIEDLVAVIPGVSWEQDVDDERLAALMTASDFTVFPSIEEGFGLPILESLWSGRPCICHNAGAMLEVANGGGCLLVDMRDGAAVADAITRLASDPGLRAALARDASTRPARTWGNYAQELALQLAQGRDSERSAPAPTVAEEEHFYSELINTERRPALSICISTYNRGPWLTVALRNLVRLLPVPRQDVEFVICDNCSSDDTAAIVAPYAARPDFRLYRNPHNVGMLGNLRVTANHARGAYVWILGDDDLPFFGSIEKILNAIAATPDIALVYLNYTYTRETDATSVQDLDEFLASGTPVVANSPDRVAAIRDLAVANENLFTAIYCLVFRRDHALRAYSQDTSGRPFSTMRTSIPTTYHVLNHMMHEQGVWIGSPQLLVNFNVSWNDYAALQILERVPEALDLAEIKGAPSAGVDRWRSNLLPGYVHYFKDIFGADPKLNSRYFSALRVISRVRHLEGYRRIAPELQAIYTEAHALGHHAAQIAPGIIFNVT